MKVVTHKTAQPEYTAKIHVEVQDPEQLLIAATERMREWECDIMEIDEALYHEDGAINVQACLVMVLDPGQTIPGVEVLNTYFKEA